MAGSAPTILVKKSDGTYVRMSLDELKARRGGGGKIPPAQKTAPASVPVVAAKPASPKKTNADFAAPLSEEPAPAANPGPKVSASRIDQVDAIIKKLSFTFPAHNLNRLRTIIQLRLKDVRSAEQTKDSLLRAELDGGMGLTARQTEEVLQKCQVKPPPRAAGEPVRPLKPRLGINRAAAENALPAARPEPPFPATSTPNNAFVHGPTEPVKPAFKLSSAPVPRPVLHDVVAKPIEMTPVDEVRYFSLTDFRRLAADPAEAARRLRQKFANLRDESIVLYLEGLTAWRSSPLYIEYLQTVLGALNSGQKLPAPRDRKMLQFSELAAIVAMEQTLEYL